MNSTGGERAPSRWARAAEAGLAFRPAFEEDLPFLFDLYASTRAEELAPVPWPDEAKQAFLRQQFHAQHTHYRTYYPDADWLVTVCDGRDVGRLYIERWAREHRIIDIAFLPESRSRGLGTALLSDLVEEAAAAGKAVSIHVEKFNPAMRLYKRLGFVFAEDKGVYDLMLRHPTDQAKTAS